MKKMICLLFSVVLLLLSAAGCQPAPTSGSSSTPPKKTEKELFDERMNELNSEYGEFIDSVEFEVVSYSEWIEYFREPDKFDKLSEVGIKGLPILIEKSLAKKSEIVDEADKSAPVRRMIFSRNFVAGGVLRIDQCDFQPNKTDRNNRYLSLYRFIKESEEALTANLDSELSAEEKLKVYREYGLMSVPYVKKELEKGKTEFEKYFLIVGAHISTPEFFKITEETRYVDEEGKVTSNYPTEEEEITNLLNHENAADFDYKEWLTENEEDLNFLYTYLDNYCAEYEAQQGK